MRCTLLGPKRLLLNSLLPDSREALFQLDNLCRLGMILSTSKLQLFILVIETHVFYKSLPGSSLLQHSHCCLNNVGNRKQGLCSDSSGLCDALLICEGCSWCLISEINFRNTLSEAIHPRFPYAPLAFNGSGNAHLFVWTEPSA